MTELPAAAWHGFGAVIDLLGLEEFERSLYHWVATIAPVSVLFGIEIFDDERPGRVVLTEGRDEDLTRRARKISRDYAAEDHAVDDVLRAHLSDQPGMIDLVVQLGRDREERFRVKYFDSMGAPEEVSAFSRTEESTLYLGASSASAGYSSGDIARLNAILPPVLSLVRRHAALVDIGGDGARRRTAPREETLRRLLAAYQGELTRREIEICAAIVMGYRAEAIAARLDISPNTVATHRKRAYAKLHISSQTELFGILFTGWSDR